MLLDKIKKDEEKIATESQSAQREKVLGRFLGYGHIAWKLLAVGKAVFDVKADGVFDVCDGFYVSVSLTVAALQRRT